MTRVITYPFSPLQEPTSDNPHVFDTPQQRLDFYRREIHYESRMLSDRTNSYMGAQSFLVIVYASSMANANEEWGDLFTLIMPMLLAVIGIGSSLHAWPGIRASVAIIRHWYFKQEQLLRSEPSFGQCYDDSPLFCQTEACERRHHKALVYSLRPPWLFVAVWIALAGFSLWLQLPTVRV